MFGKPATKIYLSVILLIAIVCVVATLSGASLRTVGLTALALFIVADVWYMFKIRALKKEAGGETDWRKEALWIAICLAIILYVVLRRLL